MVGDVLERRVEDRGVGFQTRKKTMSTMMLAEAEMNINEPWAVERGDENECDAVCSASDEKGGPDLEHRAEACKGPDEPEGNDDAEGSNDAAGDAAEEEGVETGDSVERDDGSARGLRRRRVPC